MQDLPVAVKDEEAAHPIAASCRPMLRKVVSAFVRGDYQLSQLIEGVSPVPPDVAAHIQDYIAGYGETLVELPEETWSTSCVQWMWSYWDVLVDLYTEREGASDLVLTRRMDEVEGKPQFTVGLVYVPKPQPNHAFQFVPWLTATPPDVLKRAAEFRGRL